MDGTYFGTLAFSLDSELLTARSAPVGPKSLGHALTAAPPWLEIAVFRVFQVMSAGEEMMVETKCCEAIYLETVLSQIRPLVAVAYTFSQLLLRSYNYTAFLIFRLQPLHTSRRPHSFPLSKRPLLHQKVPCGLQLWINWKRCA